MKLAAYLRPDSIEEACRSLAEAGGAPVLLLAGGQTALRDAEADMASNRIVVDLSGIGGLRRVFSQRDALFTGSMVELEAAAGDADIRETVPLLSKIAGEAGPLMVRRSATLGGSVMLADPRSHIALLFLAMGGLAIFENSERRREVAADDLFTGWRRTCREPDEVLTGLLWPGRRPRTGAGYDVLPASSGTWPDIGVAVYVQLHERGTIRLVRIAIAGVADRPVLADMPPEVHELPVAAAVYELADRAAEIIDAPPGGGRDDYRRHTIRLMARRLLQSAFDQAIETQTTSDDA